MKKTCLIVTLCLCIVLGPMALAEAGTGEILYLSFDEGSGSTIEDRSGSLPEELVQYQYLTPPSTEPMDPQWRSAGVENGSLLFDGCSTYIAYDAGKITLSGNALTISVWVAPRAFEWDDPNAAENGNAHLTAIVGQYYKDAAQGVLLGYQRFGRLCFEAGSGENWYTLWADDERLSRNAWNHVAAVFDGNAGRMTLYLNGREAVSEDIPQGVQIAPCGFLPDVFRPDG